MDPILGTLIEMGFSKQRAEFALSKTKSNDINVVMEWLLTNEEQGDEQGDEVVTPQSAPAVSIPNQPQEGANEEASQSTAVAKSIKCDECGKLFTNTAEIEFHAAKSGHEKFSESSEEKKPISEDEKKQQLAKIEEKLRQRRLEREAREKQEALEREKSRIRSGKDLLEAKKKQEDLELKKIVEQRKREKEEEKLARQRVKDQIEQDKLARKAKFGGCDTEIKPGTPPAVAVVTSPKPATNYNDVKIQVRLPNGNKLNQTFGAKEPLSAVRLFIKMNGFGDGLDDFSIMQTFPSKVFTDDDYEKPLDILGLAPSAVLFVKKL